MNQQEEQEERDRVAQVTTFLHHQIEKAKQAVKKAQAESDRVQKNYGINTSVNYLEADDRIETKADLQQQRNLVNRTVENEAIVKKQLATYQQLSHSPYFGRIDVQDSGAPTPEPLYIGTASLMDGNGEFLIHDWRAPISSVYYNGTLGPVHYQTPNGERSTTLKKKRQFKIKDGQILHMFDTNETVGDEMLQETLGNKSSDQLQNIVATIQREQNDIIRDVRSDLLVVQGVAGSGKTSALLQRIAFLLYHSRNELSANQILLFSPNLLFSNYIKDVLPSLGERNMRQVTLQSFFAQRLEGLRVQTRFDRYEASPVHNPLTTYKESQAFIDELRTYLRQLSPRAICFTGLYFQGELFFSAAEVRSIYARLNPKLPLADKFLKTKNTLIKRLKARINEEVHEDWALDELDNLSDEQYHNYLGDRDPADFLDFDEERDFVARKLVKERLRVVYDAIYNDQFWDQYSQYENFLGQLDSNDQITPADWQRDQRAFTDTLEYHQIRLVDAAPVLFLQDYFTGENHNRHIKYLFIDEVQDYSVAELMYLKLTFPRAKFNLIGDSEQALFKDVETAQALLNRLKAALPVRHPRLINLNRSYRSTYPITTLASSILPAGDHIEAFNREGDTPTYAEVPDEQQLLTTAQAIIKTEVQDHETVAIITKTKDEAQHVYQELRHQFDCLLVTDKARTLNKSVLILPVYLAKGLEFDTVIAWNVSATNFPTHHELGILYTMMTRAMHHLVLLSQGPLTDLIPEQALHQQLLVKAKSTS
ncbi:RNA polymerase recycling motor HelD [Fructilactobacillus carniphilus]|uniref:AAA family ATPase n=1 Tax=Fructilactobacillus carniphilus TaxID=2940297 RepID=A0ABY5BUJ0_9LACO|nr:RNA polymerase recycling motor HelD [Fructilactobacillus carniphilus]USS90172.1 AAA family ATPase [Fructilactobacillus carniphilus]